MDISISTNETPNKLGLFRILITLSVVFIIFGFIASAICSSVTDGNYYVYYIRSDGVLQLDLHIDDGSEVMHDDVTAFIEDVNYTIMLRYSSTLSKPDDDLYVYTYDTGSTSSKIKLSSVFFKTKSGSLVLAEETTYNKVKNMDRLSDLFSSIGGTSIVLCIALSIARDKYKKSILKETNINLDEIVSEEEEEAQETESPVQSTKKVRFCSYCGGAFDINESKCPHCGGGISKKDN